MLTAILFNYRAPDGTTRPLHVALDADGQLLFVYADVASALMATRSAQRSAPTCDPAHVRRATFDNLKNERKCVTLAGLFTCTPASRTDDGSEAAAGPAIHFHSWLRAVVLPATESEDWPPSQVELDTLQCKWLESERDRLTQAMQDIRTNAPRLEPVSVKARAQAKHTAPATVKPAAPRHNTFPNSNGFSIADDMDDFLAIRH